MLVGGATAQAISYGQPDNGAHPYVGSLVAVEDGEVFQWCSGTLISPTVFVTAAHCVSPFPDVDLRVTFDPVVSNSATLLSGTAIGNPNYTNKFGPDPKDIAVFVFDEPVTGITPARLPTANLLNSMRADGSIKTTWFVAVGYGDIRDTKRKAFVNILPGGERRKASQSFLTMQNAWVNFSMNISTGNAGTCYGDSGGPHFVGNSNLIVAITSWGDAPCKAIDVSYRLDIASARAFLDDYVTVP